MQGSYPASAPVPVPAPESWDDRMARGQRNFPHLKGFELHQAIIQQNRAARAAAPRTVGVRSAAPPVNLLAPNAVVSPVAAPAPAPGYVSITGSRRQKGRLSGPVRKVNVDDLLRRKAASGGRNPISLRWLAEHPEYAAGGAGAPSGSVDLLGLDAAPAEENLLKFPTREEELAGIFNAAPAAGNQGGGARKTRKARKSRKHRKSRRHSRK